MRKAFTLVELLVVIAIVAILVALVMPAIQYARESARRIQCTNNQRNLAVGLQNYESVRGNLPGWRELTSMVPPAVGVAPPPNYQSSDGIAAHTSWVFNILPYIERNDLYESLKSGRIMLDSAEYDTDTHIPIISVLCCPSFSGIPKLRNRAINYVANSGAVDDFANRANDPVTTDGNVANGPFLDRANIVAETPGIDPRHRHAVARLADISQWDGAANTFLTSENVQRGFWIAKDLVHFYNDRDGVSRPIAPGDWQQLPAPDNRWYLGLVSSPLSGNSLTSDTIEGSVAFCWPRDYYNPQTIDPSTICYLGLSSRTLDNPYVGFSGTTANPQSDVFSFEREPYDETMIPVFINKFPNKQFSESWYPSARPSSPHAGVVVASFCDSAVRSLNSDISETVFVQLMTASDAQSDAGRRIPIPGVKNFLEGKLFDSAVLGR